MSSSRFRKRQARGGRLHCRGGHGGRGVLERAGLRGDRCRGRGLAPCCWQRLTRRPGPARSSHVAAVRVEMPLSVSFEKGFNKQGQSDE